MANNNVAILSVMAKFDENSVKQVAQKFNKSMDQVQDGFKGLDFAPELVESFDSAMKKIESKFKNVNLSKYTSGILKDLIDDTKGLEEKSASLQNFIGKIEALNKASYGKKSGVFDTFNTKQLDELFKYYDEIEKKQESLNKKQLEYENTAKRAVENARSANGLKKAYNVENTNYKERINEIKQTLGMTGQLNAAENKILEKYSKLLSIFDLMEKSKPEEGTIESVKYSQELLNIVKEIQATEKLIGNSNYTQSLASKESTSYYSDIEKTSEYTVMQAINAFKNAQSSAILDAISEIETNIANYIKNTIKSNASSIVQTAEEVVDQIDQKLEEKKKNQGKKTGGNFANNGYSGEETGSSSSVSQLGRNIDNASDSAKELNSELDTIAENTQNNNIDLYAESAKRLSDEFKDVIKYAVDAETAFNRINEIWEKYDKGLPTTEQEQKDMWMYMQRLDELSLNGLADGYTLNEDQLDEFNEWAEYYKKQFQKISEMTEAQINELNALEEAQKVISGETVPTETISPVIEEQTRTLQDYVSELQNEEKQLRATNEAMKEHIALFDKNGNILYSSIGDERSSEFEMNPDATTLMHSHPFNNNYDLLRFDDDDINAFLSNAVGTKLRQSIVYCGDELLSINIDGLNDSQIKNLNDQLNRAILAVMMKLGNIDEDQLQNGVIAVKEKDLTKFDDKFQNEYSRLVNGIVAKLVEDAGGIVQRQKINPNKTITDVGFDISNLEKQQLSAMASSMKYGMLQQTYDTYEKFGNQLQILQNKIDEFDIDVSENELISFVEALEKANFPMEEFEEKLNKLNLSSNNFDLYDIRNQLLGLTKVTDQVREFQDGSSDNTTPKKDRDVYNEIEQFEELRKKIVEVETAIDNKIKKIVEEKSSVESAIPEEITKFNELKQKIDELASAFDLIKLDGSKINVEDINSKLNEINNQINDYNIVDNEISSSETPFYSISEQAKDAIDEIDKVEKKYDSLKATVFHGAKSKWDNDSFDFDKTKASQMGAGMYFTSDAEKVSNFGKLGGIKELELELDKCFIITKEYITNLDDIYAAMEKTVPDSASIEQAVNDMRIYCRESIENSRTFRENMLSMGYQGMYVGDNLANKIIPEELVVYDEVKLEKLKSFTNKEFKELQKVGSIEIDIASNESTLSSGSTTSLLEEEKELVNVLTDENSTLEEKLEYLKLIKSESKFMETSRERLSDMEDKAWDVGGNNPKSEADSQSKIRKYEELEEHINRADEALDTFIDTYEQVIITMKNGEKITIDDLIDLDDVSLAKNKIQDISFKLLDDENNISNNTDTVRETTEEIQKQETELSRLIQYWKNVNKYSLEQGKSVKENAAYFNVGTGQVTDYVEGEAGHLSQELIDSVFNNAKIAVDGAIHTHGDWNKAAFSVNDLKTAYNDVLRGIKTQVLMSMDEVMTLDLNGVNGIDLEEIINQYEVRTAEAKDRLTKEGISDIDTLQIEFQKILKELFDSKNLSSHLQLTSVSDWLKQNPVMSDFKPQEFKSNKGSGSYTTSIKEEQQAMSTAAESEKSDLSSIRGKVEELETAFRNKTNAITEEKIAMQVAAQGEVSAIDSIINKVVELISKLKEVENAPISIDIKLPDTLDSNTSQVISNIKESLSGFSTDELNALSSIIPNLKISKSNVENLQSLANVILTLKSNLNNLNEGGSNFLSSINELLSKSKELENLADILKSSKEKINEVNKSVGVNNSEEVNYINILSSAYADAEENVKRENEYLKKRNRLIAEGKKQEKEYYDNLSKSRSSIVKTNDSQSVQVTNKLSPNNTSQKSDEYLEALNKIDQKYKEIQAYGDLSKLVEEKDIQNVSRLQSELDALLVGINNVNKGSKDLSVSKTINNISKYMSENTKMSKQFKNQLKELINTLRILGNNADVAGLTDEFIRLQTEIREAGQEGKSFASKIKQQFTHGVAQAFAMYFSLYDVIRYIREGINTIKEFDTALTEMKKVSDETTESLKAYQKTTFDIANEVGTTAKEIQESTADWMEGNLLSLYMVTYK